MNDALAIAYAFLNRRERTVAEVRARLEREDLAAGDVEGALAELRALHCLDDARYARLFVQDKRALESWGSERIARALTERGIDDELIAAALGDEETDLGRATALLARRFPAGPTDDSDRRRALGVLVRKGYDSEIAYDAVRAWSSAGAGTADDLL
jgi:regulatory protein